MSVRPYEALFPMGSRVRVADRETLNAFAREWKFHHKLTAAQLLQAGNAAVVASICWYHGGDALYRLDGVPGLWHEQCLGTIDGPPVTG